ncbi:MAG: hypothetical protein HOP29_07970 [Phycisphaerales bacterium]|nr:hypothetical protein [Phycisphaerales bacterium]
MFLSFRRYDVQARWAVGVAVTALAPLGVAVWSLLRRYDGQLGAISYSRQGLFLPGFLATIGVTGLMAAVAVVLGFNSAGQRRNDRQGLSWAGFFMGTAVLSLSLIALAAFMSLRMAVTSGSPTG